MNQQLSKQNRFYRFFSWAFFFGFGFFGVEKRLCLMGWR